jgi:hypothetical protein
VRFHQPSTNAVYSALGVLRLYKGQCSIREMSYQSRGAEFAIATSFLTFSPPPHAGYSAESPSMSSQLHVKRNLPASFDQVTKIPNSSAQKRARHRVSLPYSSTALSPPSFPTRPGSSVLIDCHSGDSLTAESHWTGKKLTNRPQSTSSASHPATTADWMPCRPRGTNRHAP